ncbi:NAD(P)-binding protein [Trametes meyenii]|nr:NAD(P)-binding protein [Trametes meyenii]
MVLTPRLKLIQHSTLPPKPKFGTADIPDLTGRVMLVTGGNSGIGKEIVKGLLEHNATVYLGARSRERAEAAIEELHTQTGRRARFLALDLASLASVRTAAEELLSLEQELHVLFNNAGVMWRPVEETTADGYDMQFGTNVLGHFYLTKLLMPALLRGAASSPDGRARVVATSSGYAYVGRMRLDTLADGPARRKVSTEDLYNQSKLGDVLVAFELARRYGAQGIVSTALHPGVLKTDLLSHVKGIMHAFYDSMMFPAPMGALTPLYAGTSPEGAELNGKFLIPWARVANCPNKAAYDETLAKQLWEWLEEQVKTP